MIPDHLIKEYFRFHVYQSGVYFKKFTPDEVKGNDSWLKNKFNNLGTPKYTYHILQFLFPESETLVRELAMVYSVFGANDLEEISELDYYDWDSYKSNKIPLQNCTIFDRFELGGIENHIGFSDIQNNLFLSSENMGFILNVRLKMANKTNIEGKFKFISTSQYCYSPKAIFYP